MFKTWEQKFAALRWVVVLIGVGLLVNAWGDVRSRTQRSKVADRIDAATVALEGHGPDEVIDALQSTVDELRAQLDEIEAGIGR